MKNIRCFFLSVAAMLAATVAIAQTGFNYQAVIRDAEGNLLADQDVALRITLSNDDNVLYQETQTKPTNAYGVVSIVVGAGTPTMGMSFDRIDWSKGDISMKTEFDPTGVGTDDLFVTVSTTPLQSVPTAEYAKTTSAVKNPKEIEIQATNETGDDEALFSVKDDKGNVVFAVYKNGVRVYVDDTDTDPNGGSKAAKSGFAVAGRSGKAGEGNTYFAVNDQGTQVYVDDDPTEPGKAAKAKFAVAGKSGKADDNYLIINKAGTQIFVDDTTDSKAAKAKFAVAGKSGKADDNLLVVNQSGTKVFVDDDGTKAAKAKFAVAGRSGKAGENANFFAIDDEGTQVYVDDDPTMPGKAAKAKFAVAGKSGKADDKYMIINKAGTQIFVDDTIDSKAAKAKFAVAGKSGKADDNLLVVNQSGTKVFVDDDGTKAAKAKFAVAGKSGKSVADNYFVINDEGTKVFVDGVNGKAAKAKFAVASVRHGKDSVAEDFFLINKDGTKVFIDEATHDKAAKATFAVASVKKSNGKDGDDDKDGVNPNYLVIDSDSTRVYIDNTDNGKAAKSGFAVAGKSGGKGNNADILKVTKDSTRVYVDGGGAKSGFGVEGKDGASDGKSGFAVTEKGANGNAGYMNITAQNFFAGYDAGRNTKPNESEDEGFANTFVGNNAGFSNITGALNVFLGDSAGFSNEDGTSNVFIGPSAGKSNTDGQMNIYMGYKAGFKNKSGGDNIYLGYFAGANDTASSDNIFLGYAAGYQAYGRYNILMGAHSGQRLSVSNYNTILGYQAAGSAGKMNKTIAIGYYAGHGSIESTSENDIFIGDSAGYSNTTGANNVFFGNLAGYSNTTGYENLFIGNNTGRSITTGHTNIILGRNAGTGLSEEQGNIIIGVNSGKAPEENDYEKTAANNIYIGHDLGGYSGGGNMILGNVKYVPKTGGANAVYDRMNNDLRKNRIKDLKTRADEGNTFAILQGDNVLLVGNFLNFSLTTGGSLSVNGNLVPERRYINPNSLATSRWLGSENARWDMIYGNRLNIEVDNTNHDRLDFNNDPNDKNTKASTIKITATSDSRNVYGTETNVDGECQYAYGHRINMSTEATAIYGFDVYVSDESWADNVYAINSIVDNENDEGTNVAVRGISRGAAKVNYGVMGQASGASNLNVGVYGSGSGSNSYAGLFDGRLRVSGAFEAVLANNTDFQKAMNITVTGNNTSKDASGGFTKVSGKSYNAYGHRIEMHSEATNLYGFDIWVPVASNSKNVRGVNSVVDAARTGSTNYAVYGVTQKGGGNETASTNYGVYGQASGASTNYGVYGKASGGTNYAGYFSGNLAYSGSLTPPSDSRLKKDVKTLDGALDKVLKLRGVSYYWKNREEMAAVRGVSADSLDYGYAEGLQIGVIAQELEEIMPELVHTDGDGFKSVDYVKLTPVLIEAIKEQQQQIDELKRLVEELMKKQ